MSGDVDDRKRERISGNQRIVFIPRKLGNVRAACYPTSGGWGDDSSHLSTLYIFYFLEV